MTKSLNEINADEIDTFRAWDVERKYSWPKGRDSVMKKMRLQIGKIINSKKLPLKAWTTLEKEHMNVN